MHETSTTRDFKFMRGTDETKLKLQGTYCTFTIQDRGIQATLTEASTVQNTTTIGEILLAFKRKPGCKLVLGASRTSEGRVLTPLLMKKEKRGR